MSDKPGEPAAKPDAKPVAVAPTPAGKGTPIAAAPATNAPAAKVKTGANLWAIGAAVRAFCNIPLDFYPRLGAKARSMSSEDIVRKFSEAMDGWGNIPTLSTKATDGAIDLDTALDLAKASLEEAKSQTEYQDQKATRLLTVTTLLTALAGAFFSNFASDFPLRTIHLAEREHWLLVATYGFFLLFVLFALTGSLVTFHATRTRFRYPAHATVAKQDGPTRSFLFYREIIGVTPEGWANSFVTVGADKTSAAIRSDLGIEYFRNYVSEAYLIAAKTADKLRHLQPGQSLLAFALRCLIVYVVLLAIVAATLTPTKPAPAPTAITIVAPVEPVRVKIESTPKPTQSAAHGAVAGT